MSQDGGGNVQDPLPAESQPQGPPSTSKLKTPSKTKEIPGKSKANASKVQAEGTGKPKQSKSRNGELFLGRVEDLLHFLPVIGKQSVNKPQAVLRASRNV